MDKKQRSTRIKITERALFQRINRKLQKRGENLRSRAGHYFIIEANRKAVTTQHVNLETLGRKLGVIQPWEEVA